MELLKVFSAGGHNIFMIFEQLKLGGKKTTATSVQHERKMTVMLVKMAETVK